jgi:hypothetical protein
MGIHNGQRDVKNLRSLDPSGHRIHDFSAKKRTGEPANIQGESVMNFEWKPI